MGAGGGGGLGAGSSHSSNSGGGGGGAYAGSAVVSLLQEAMMDGDNDAFLKRFLATQVRGKGGYSWWFVVCGLWFVVVGGFK